MEDHSISRVSTWGTLVMGCLVLLATWFGFMSLPVPLALLVSVCLVMMALYTFYETDNWHEFNHMTPVQKVLPVTTVTAGAAGMLLVVAVIVLTFLILWMVGKALESR